MKNVPVDDIREANRMSLTSSFSGREIANMGFNLAIIGHAQGNNVRHGLTKGNIVRSTESVE